LAEEGLHGVVLVATKRSEKALLDLVSELNKAHPAVKTRIILHDLTKKHEIDELIREVSDLDIRVLINNAGYGLNGRFDKLDLDAQLDMVNLNCNAPLHLAHGLVNQHWIKSSYFESSRATLAPKRPTSPLMAVVNVGSLAGLVPAIPYQTVYAASKAFVASLSRGLALEWRKMGVLLVTVEPGTFSDSAFQKRSLQPLHKGHNTTDSIVEATVSRLKELHYDNFEIIPSLHDRITEWGSRFLPRSVILPMCEKRGLKYTPKNLM
jgi:short-subunit dehydrogenase